MKRKKDAGDDKIDKMKEKKIEAARLLLDGMTPKRVERRLGLRTGAVGRWLTEPSFDRLCADLSGATDVDLQQQRRRLQEKAVREVRRMMYSRHGPSVRFAIRIAFQWLADRRAAYSRQPLSRAKEGPQSTN